MQKATTARLSDVIEMREFETLTSDRGYSSVVVIVVRIKWYKQNCEETLASRGYAEPFLAR